MPGRDGGMPMKINVTWSDIHNGKSAKTMECMVALALKRELGIAYASVGHRSATILIDGQYIKVYLPRKVENKIKSWDRSHFVLPFSFELSCSGFLAGQRLEYEYYPSRMQPAFVAA
jgi:hypothetical protein